MTKRMPIALLVAALLLLVISCSQQPVDSNPPLDGLNLETEFGGYDTQNQPEEVVELDDLANDEFDLSFLDPIALTPEMDSLVKDREAVYFKLRIVWGRLSYDASSTIATSWDGSLETNNGALVVRRIINFERGPDIILERTDRKLIEWQSSTTVYHDGIAVDLYVPHPGPLFDTTIVTEIDSLGDTSYVIVVDTLMPEPVTLSLDLGNYHRVFTLAELTQLDTVVQLDDGNAIALHALRLHRYSCPGGYMLGHWSVDDHGLGILRGWWVSSQGQRLGYVTGHYGKNQSGENVFFAKVLRRDGRFEWFLKGRFGRNPNHSGGVDINSRRAGWFAGKMFNAERVEIGSLAGRFREGTPGQRGFFQAHWKLRCAAESIDPGDG